MRLFLLTLTFMLSSLFTIMGQSTESIEGKTFILGEYTWEFKENGVVRISGGIAGDGTDGKYILKEKNVIAETGDYRIFGTYDGTDFIITEGEDKRESETVESKTINYNEVRIREFPIALQCYTYRRYSFMETLDKAVELGIKYIQPYPGQKLNADGSGSMSPDMTEDEIKLVKNRLEKLGLTLTQFGVADVYDESSAGELFEFAKTMGIKTVVIEPAFNLLPMIDKLANQYRINVAIHNHPSPSRYWHAGITYFHIKDLSPRIGICGDTGHWTRSGVTATEALKLFKGRIFDVHLKDLNEFGKMEAYDVPFGQGKTNIKHILAELSLQNYRGTITFEHEKEEDAMNPGPPILEGIEYIKKLTYYEGYEEILGFSEGRYNKHGWNHYGPGYFELDSETGVLTSSGGMGLMWYSARVYENFVIDLDYMCHTPNTNSGVFLRVPNNVVVSNDYIHRSFEIQIDDADTLTIHTTGSVYDAEAAKMLAANPPGEWNHFRISFIGDIIKVVLNGQLINTWKAEPRGKINSFASKGYVGLQNHDSEAKVSFKNIFIKEL